MQPKDILKTVDHTLLSTTARWPQIQELCENALKYGTASVCVPPSFVAQAATYLDQKKAALYPDLSPDALPWTAPVVCTVIGFPNGYNTTAVKCFEASDAVRNGAVEVDMVINLGFLKEGKLCRLKDEINAVKQAAVSAAIAMAAEQENSAGNTCEQIREPVLKVIVETCALTPQEIADITKIVDASHADFIKTSTGFAEAGATFEDIRIFKENITGDTKIKAAGGISSLEDAEQFLELGANRLGTSRIVKIMKQREE